MHLRERKLLNIFYIWTTKSTLHLLRLEYVHLIEQMGKRMFFTFVASNRISYAFVHAKYFSLDTFTFPPLLQLKTLPYSSPSPTFLSSFIIDTGTSVLLCNCVLFLELANNKKLGNNIAMVTNMVN